MNQSLDRRTFIKLLGASALTTSCKWTPDFSQFAKKTELYSGYRVGEPYTAKDAGLHIGGPDVNQRVQLKNEIHSAVYSKKLDVKVFIPKLENVGYVQIGKGELKPFTSLPGHYFYGHAVVDEKRGLLYSTHSTQTPDRTDVARVKKDGLIYVHSLPDVKFIGSFSSYGYDPHDLHILNDQLIVCNGGADSNVTIIDLATKKLVSDYKLGVAPLSLRHLEILDPDHFVVATLSREDNVPCSLYSLNRKEGFKKHACPPMVEERFLIYQMLSVKAHDGFIYGTCPGTSSLVVYEAHKGFVSALSVPSACNLSYSKELGGMIVGSAYDKEQARLVKVEQGKLVVTMIPWATKLTGAHSLLIES